MNSSNSLRINPKWLTLAEVVLAGLAFIVLGIFLSRYAGGPVKSDEVMYINNGLMNVKDTFILNRYTHIYFQKLFMALADNPYTGVKNYWGFLVAGSAALTYLISRLGTRSGGVVHAGISTLLYLSIPLLALNSGNTAVDIAAGFFMTLTVFVYILSFKFEKRNAFLLSLFGFFFFLSFRTKETTLALVVLLVGLIFNDEGRADLRIFLKRMGYVLSGLLAGIVLFAILNGIFLKDPWFGLRLSEYFKFKSTYVDHNIAEDSKTIANWLTDYLFNGSLFIFLAFVLSGVRVVKKQDYPLRFPWLVPLVFVFILSAIIGFSKWGVVERHIFPVLPLLCAFAPQFILFPKLRTKKDLFWLGISVVITGTLLVLGRYLLMKASTLGPYNYPEYLSSSIYPIVILVLIGMVFFFRKYSFKNLFIPLLIFAIFIRYPLSLNTTSFFSAQPNVNKMNERLQIFRGFEDKYKIRPANKIIVFQGALFRLNYSSRYAEFIGLFNMYFDARLETDNVIMINPILFDPEIINVEKPDYILMTVEDYSIKAFSDEVKNKLSEEYNRYQNKGKQFFLFVKK